MNILEKIIEGNILRLIPISEKHLEYLRQLRLNVQVCESIIPEAISEDEQKEWYRNLRNAKIFIINHPCFGNIGTIGLTDINMQHQRAKWNLRIHPDHWRKGYAKESIGIFLDYVFNTLNINKLMGDCFADNIAEVNNLRKLGFKEEGVWKEHYYHKGQFRDSIQFVMFKKDYQNQSK